MDFLIGILNVLLVIGSLFMVCVILIQRGKGGGLAGAFGGVGGSSAFGTKAGDIFTKITIGVAVGWILTAMLLVVLTNRRTSSAWGTDTPTSLTKDLTPSSSRSKDQPATSQSQRAAAELPPPSPTPASAMPPAAPADLPAPPPIPPSVPSP